MWTPWLLHGLGDVAGEAPILENAEEAFVAISSVAVTASMGGGAVVEAEKDGRTVPLPALVDPPQAARDASGSPDHACRGRPA